MKGRKLQKRTVDSIKIGIRHRQDLGDIQSLAVSISKIGLINPITVTSEGLLIAGERRLAAVKSLGWRTIQCVVADDLESAISRLMTERDENTERKEMTISERVSLGKALETLEKPKAKARQISNLMIGPVKVRRSEREPSGKTPARVHQEHETRRIVGKAVGLSGATYERAKTVVNAANNEDLPEEERIIAKAALAEMDTTGNVTGNYNKVRKPKVQPILTKKSMDAEAKKQRYAFNNTLPVLSGATLALIRIEDIHSEIAPDEITQWINSLSETRRNLERVIKRLKDRNNA